jgi:hypothetical protein
VEEAGAHLDADGIDEQDQPEFPDKVQDLRMDLGTEVAQEEAGE